MGRPENMPSDESSGGMCSGDVLGRNVLRGECAGTGPCVLGRSVQDMTDGPVPQGECVGQEGGAFSPTGP
jgi:hypothetical protein